MISLTVIQKGHADDPFGGKKAALYTKTYKVSSDFVSRLSNAHSDPFAETKTKPNLMNSLRSAGISFPTGGKAVFNEKDSTLIATATPAEMKKIDALVDRYGASKGSKSRPAPKLSPIDQKLSSIILPKVQFDDKSIKECVASLSAEIKKRDPDNVGVPVKLELPKEGKVPNITLDLTDIPANLVLKFTAELAGLKLTTNDKGAVIAP